MGKIGQMWIKVYLTENMIDQFALKEKENVLGILAKVFES